MPVWVIIILAILMVVGSVVWVRPSPRDKRLAEWRRDAIVAGMKVKLEGLAAEPKDSGIRHDIGEVSYILYQHNPVKGDDKRWAVAHHDGWMNDGLPQGWSWHKESNETLAENITAHIKNAPLPILAIERTPYLSRVVWNETAGDFDSNQLKSFLESIQLIS